MSYTLVAFHAHPDDEVLFTGGTLARAAAEGHRVVLVVATDGSAGLASTDQHDGGLAQRRLRELEGAAAALGCAEVVRLGFVDSGWRTQAPADAFSRMDPDVAAAPLVEVLRRERADALTIYDAAGGYGHPDHVQVHRVGRRAAELAGTRLVLEATIDRDLIRPLVRVASAIPRLLPSVRAQEYATAYTPRPELTHRVDVRAYVATKRIALQAHTSQTTGDEGLRTVALLLLLPRWLLRRLLGTEWFVEVGRTPGPLLDDIFATLE